MRNMLPASADNEVPRDVTHKLIESHLLDGEMVPGEEVSIRVDQVLTHDATGPLIALELEAMGLDEIRPELAVGYVDHLPVQDDSKSAEDTSFCAVRASASGCGIRSRATASVTPSTRNASACPARRSSAPTATPAPPALSACSRSGPVGCR